MTGATASEGLRAPSLVLASASPRRRALLNAAGVEFEIAISDVDESPHQQGTPRAAALQTALLKAHAVAERIGEGRLVLAADTVVGLDGEILNKPRDRADGATMLARLSGREHAVTTAVALMRPAGEVILDADQATVHFHELSPEQIEAYLATGEGDDKAGAYGIQGLSAQFVAAVRGDISCVIGLPLGLVANMYRQATGYELFGDIAAREILLRAFPEMRVLPADCLAEAGSSRAGNLSQPE